MGNIRAFVPRQRTTHRFKQRLVVLNNEIVFLPYGNGCRYQKDCFSCCFKDCMIERKIKIEKTSNYL